MPSTLAPALGRGRGAALAALVLATFCFVTSENLPAGLLALIARDLDSSLSAVGLLVTGYGLTVAAVSIPLARITRDIPRRPLLSGLLGVFVLASLASALAPHYPLMLAGRVVTAVAHAVFWALVVVTATGMFPPRVRGRIVTVIFGASSVATVAGVPAGAWLGELSGWRVAFLGLTGLGAIAMVTIAALLPTTPPEQTHASSAPAPDRRRYATLLAATVLSISGLSAATTYTVPFLTEVNGFSSQAIGPLLFVRGAAGVLVLTAGGILLDRWPRASVAVPTAVLALALFGLYAAGRDQALAIGFLALSGAAMMLMISAMANRVLHVAPGRTEAATAAHSAAFNASIAAGALIGALILPQWGVGASHLAAGILVCGAFACLAADSGRTASRAAPGGGPPCAQPPAGEGA